MPLYREWSSDDYSLAAIWEIEEPESFFVERTGLHSDIVNHKRRMEFLVGRFLLQYLRQDFPLLNIKPDIHDKPRLDNNQFYFSISHSFPYVAVVVSPYVECGIDIQVERSRMAQLQQKFLSGKEMAFFKNDTQLLTLAWCCKEASYKWQGRRGVDFSKHIEIENVKKAKEDYIFNISLKINHPATKITCKGFINKDFAFSIAVNP